MSAFGSDDGHDGAPPLGTVLEGRYRLVGHIGEGGVGWVYRAEHLRLGTQVAIKMLQSPYQQHEMLRPRFEREARVLAELRHPHIVTLTDYSVAEGGRPYLVMELLEGQTLGDLMDRGPMPDARARRILGQMLDALSYAHGRGFAHRDLKPTNIFLVELPTDPDHVKLLDFGFVKLLHPERNDGIALTTSGVAFGTPSYMCPEQATGGVTDPRADLYSAGVVFFEMLAGQRPFIGEIPAIIRQHLTAAVPALDVGGAPIAPTLELTAFLARALAKDPKDRFQTAIEMHEALDALPVPALTVKRTVDSFAPTMPPPPPGPGDPDAPRRDEKTHRATPPLPEPRPPEPRLPEPRRPPTGRDDASAPPPAPRKPRRVGLALVALSSVAGAVAIVWAQLDGTVGPGPEAPRPTAEGSALEARAAEPPAGDADERGPAETTPEDGTLEEGALLEEGPLDEGPLDEGALDEGALDEAPSEDAPDEVLAAPETESDLDFTHDEAALGGPVEPRADEDPWAARPRVPELAAARRVVDAGRPLTPAAARALRVYARAHRDDPRPHLLLAADFVERGYDTAALERYSLAQRVDPRARHAARMLSDLVRLAAGASVGDEAAALLVEAYGSAARGAIDERLQAGDLDARARERLTAARARVAD